MVPAKTTLLIFNAADEKVIVVYSSRSFSERKAFPGERLFQNANMASFVKILTR
jgi:hypothetical protein